MTGGGHNAERREIVDHDAYYNGQFKASPRMVAPGECVCSADPDVMLVAKVGSGVVVCIHDLELGLGGMVHLLLPQVLVRKFPRFADHQDKAFQYAESIIEKLISDLKRQGAGKNRIKIKLFGGTSILEELMDSGLKNYVFAKEYLLDKGLTIVSEDIGGEVCRRIHFFPHSGQVVRRQMRRAEDIAEFRGQEERYLAELSRTLSP